GHRRLRAAAWLTPTNFSAIWSFIPIGRSENLVRAAILEIVTHAGYASVSVDSMTTYSAKSLRSVENRPGTWNSIEVGVFRQAEGREEQIGSYLRNHPNFYDTFCVFRMDDCDYALYSPDYTATRLLELPSCRDVGGEERHVNGFCPVEYFVP